MTLLAALHSAAGTLQALAAAWISIMRAAAPPLRTYSLDCRMPRLPPVEKSPHTRLRATDWPGVGYSVVTFVQSQSSSSATICARPVSVPCPISERAIRTTTVSSGRMTTHAFISGEPSCARTTLVPNGIFRPRVSPAPTAAVPMTNERRSIFGVLMIMALPLCLRRGVNGFAHLLERTATADVGDPRVDVGVGRLRLVLQKRRHRHDHPGLAVTALGHVVVDPGLLDLVQDAAVRQALDRGDLLALHRGDRQHAGTDRLAVEVHRAGTAHRDAASVLGPREADLLSDRPQKGRIGADVDLLGFAVDGQARHGLSSQDCPSLQRLDLHLAPLDGAAGRVVGPVAELKRERSLRVLAVLNAGGLDAVQHHGELRALGRDLVRVPFAAGLGHRRDLGHVDDSAGAVGRVGTLLVDVHLVGVGRGDRVGIRAADEDTAVRGVIRPELRPDLKILVGALRDEEAALALVRDDGAGLGAPVGITDPVPV